MSVLNKLEPSDIIAIIVLIGGLILKGIGLNGDVSLMLIAIISYYFGYSTYKRAKKPRNIENDQERYN